MLSKEEKSWFTFAASIEIIKMPEEFSCDASSKPKLIHVSQFVVFPCPLTAAE
jgi:hypothetical protein